MFHYLKEAFWVKPRVAGLGAVPVNALAALGFTILGFGHSGFWWLGAGVEALFLLVLSTNTRFQNWVDARSAQVSSQDAEAMRQSLIKALPSDLTRKYALLRDKCAKVLEVYQSSQAESYVTDESSRVLRNLKWVYLKLLVARKNLLDVANAVTEDGLTHDIAALEKSLQKENESESLKESQKATLAILKKRLDNIRRKDETLEEIGSDCTRIEAQVDLILENASMAGKPQTITADLDFSSNVLDSSFFGESEQAVQNIDQSYSRVATKVGN